MSKSYYKQYLKLKLEETNDKIAILDKEKRRIHQEAYDWFVDKLLIEMIDDGISDWPWQKLAECMNLKDLKRERIMIEQQLHPKAPIEGYIAAYEISLAKAKSIGDLLGVTNDRKNIKCPIHDDHHPSAKWYKARNMLKCFACGWYGDSIDLTMKLHNLDFLSAVKKLIA